MWVSFFQNHFRKQWICQNKDKGYNKENEAGSLTASQNRKKHLLLLQHVNILAHECCPFPDRRTFFPCKVTPDSFTQRLLASLFSSTWWWLFKDGWRKTEASRYGMWLRPPASCESDSICLNVWEQAKRKEPSFLSEIWSSSYLSLVEEIHRCPERSTGQLWYGELLQSWWVGRSQNTASTFQPMKEELFIFGKQNNLFTPECVLCLGIFPFIVFICHWSHYNHGNFMFWCYLMGFCWSLKGLNNRTISDWNPLLK